MPPRSPLSRTARRPLSMIAALTPSRVIGHDGGMPWHLPEDMKHFRRLTRGHAVIMGRATYESIGKPLKRRQNIVVSSNTELRYEGCEVASSLERALALVSDDDDEPFVIGGARLYTEALPLATRLYLTHLEQEHAGDVFFPEVDYDAWREVERRAGDGLSWVTYERR